ncbi:MAG TPA: D-glycero-beta-D-manno-heptose 1-phosphate adenylyltransferase [Candidatus Krumholzibacteriaceae bacterium]|nr:D-glycero-beta-D-manno-heptose 1-phosphate adenylyltransferase [Candidatus Krumholzibacteriaceae bacterium]
MNEYTERIINPVELSGFRKDKLNGRVVFTNGCFDILHRGHVELLVKARSFGDCLVVGINSDRSLRRLKGHRRPLTKEYDRAFILLNLVCVDYVTVFEEDTPVEVIRKLKPDILVKGDEYSVEEIAGADFVLRNGGEVKRVKMVEGYSTSKLINKLKK